MHQRRDSPLISRPSLQNYVSLDMGSGKDGEVHVDYVIGPGMGYLAIVFNAGVAFGPLGCSVVALSAVVALVSLCRGGSTRKGKRE